MRKKFPSSDLNNPVDSVDKTSPETESLWTVEEVAQYLRLETETIRNMARERKLPSMKLGRVWRFRPDLVKEWVVAQSSVRPIE